MPLSHTKNSFGKRLRGRPIGALPPSRSAVRETEEEEEEGEKDRRQLSLMPRDTSSSKLPLVLPPLAQGPFPPVAVWPSKRRCSSVTSKAPLAVQLEAFIRNEHRLYVREHRLCMHGDTLHIVREAFSVLIEHFVEYAGILSLIREEYEAAFGEIQEEVKRLRAVNLEGESDRSLHAMELMRQRESLTAIIRNQQAQLQASQGLVHSLRDQISQLEEVNLQMKLDAKEKLREHSEAVATLKLLANAMTEETTRTTHFINLYKAGDREVARLILQVKDLREKLDDSDNRFRALSKQVMLSGMMTGSLVAQEEQSESEKTDSKADGGEKKEADPTVFALQRRIDDLMFAYEQLKCEVAGGANTATVNAEPEQADDEPEEQKKKKNELEGKGLAQQVVVDATTSNLIRSWLLEEQISERDVDAEDYLLPPGEWDGDPLSFLKVCRPVRNRRLSTRTVTSLLRKFWRKRESDRQTPLKRFFLHWLIEETGSEASAQEVGFNALYVCQRHPDDPEFRGIMLVLHSFLPEEMISTWRNLLCELEETCRDSITAVDGAVQTSFVSDMVRHVMPEWSYVHMVRLRLYLWRLAGESGKVKIDTLFHEDSHFVYLFKKQFLEAVEEFTLQVVESVRSAAKGASTVALRDVTEAISALDEGIGKGTLHRIVAEATQMTAMDVATADANFTVKLQPLLRRFRCAVLLRRSMPLYPRGETKPLVSRLLEASLNETCSL